jgi:predicted  nucleic acid-binding Zn-ribbon protein
MRVMRTGAVILCLIGFSAVGCATSTPPSVTNTPLVVATTADTNASFSTSVAVVPPTTAADASSNTVPDLQPIEPGSTLVAQIVDEVPSELTFSDQSLLDPNVLAQQNNGDVAQLQSTPTVQPPTATPAVTAAVEFGSTTGVDTSTGAVQVSFNLAEPRMINIFALDVDGNADPRIFVFNANNRLLTFSDDHFTRRDDLGPLDSAVENALLLPGTYSVRVETASPGRVNLSIEEGDGGALGMGQTTLIPGTLPAGQRFLQRVQFNANELVTITALSQTPDFDTRLRLENLAGEALARNDDLESFDILPDVTDAQISNFIVPETGEYQIEVRAFSANQTGEFILMIQRFGTLEPVAGEPQQVLTGEVLSRQRLDFPLTLQGGELVSVTAVGPGGQVDPQVTLIDPANIVVISNDDHGTNDESITQFDARFTNYVVQADGEYTLQLESVSGRGPYEITVDRLGRVNPESLGAPIDPAANEAAPLPTEEPQVVQPESSAEVTPES